MVVWSHRHPFVNLNHYLTYSETKKIIKIYNLVPNLIDLRSCENEDRVQKAIKMKEKPMRESTVYTNTLKKQNALYVILLKLKKRWSAEKNIMNEFAISIYFYL